MSTPFGFKPAQPVSFSSLKADQKNTWLEQKSSASEDEDGVEESGESQVSTEPETPLEKPTVQTELEPKACFQSRVKIFKKDGTEWKGLGVFLLSIWDDEREYMSRPRLH